MCRVLGDLLVSRSHFPDEDTGTSKAESAVRPRRPEEAREDI